jgi:hypothetical protein
MIAANNGHVLAFDDLSSLSPWLSDALCRLASGGSFAVRQLYTDDEEVLFKAARPTLLNGIEDVIGQPDLADRAIFLALGPIEEVQRRSESELWRVRMAVCALGHGLRNGTLACRHVQACPHRQSQGRNRGRHRRGRTEPESSTQGGGAKFRRRRPRKCRHAQGTQLSPAPVRECSWSQSCHDPAVAPQHDRIDQP